MSYKYCIVAFLLLLGVFSCKIETVEPTFRNFYTFDISVSMSNVKMEYNTNDIVWLEISIPGKLIMDQESMEDVFVGNARFPISIKAEEISKSPADSNQVALILQNGELVKDSSFHTNGVNYLTFGCPEPNYLFKAGVQFKKPGAYLLTLNPDEPVKNVVFNESTDCSIYQDQTILPKGTDVGSVSYEFNASDLNLDVFKNFANSNTINKNQSSVETQIAGKQVFFVKVI
ncbi:MAG: hypothetical protein R2784_12020 [Saprospiraceae bacterium]